MSIDLVDDLGRLFSEQWRIWLPLACGFLALCATAIGHRPARLGIGTVAGLLALLLGWSWWIRASAPGHRLEGAFLTRKSWGHWSFAIVASLIFFGVVAIAIPSESASPGHCPTNPPGEAKRNSNRAARE